MGIYLFSLLVPNLSSFLELEITLVLVRDTSEYGVGTPLILVRYPTLSSFRKCYPFQGRNLSRASHVSCYRIRFHVSFRSSRDYMTYFPDAVWVSLPGPYSSYSGTSGPISSMTT